MPTGVKPRDVNRSQPTNPLRVGANRVVSPTLGGAGNSVHRPTSELDPFVDKKKQPANTRMGIPTPF